MLIAPAPSTASITNRNGTPTVAWIVPVALAESVVPRLVWHPDWPQLAPKLGEAKELLAMINTEMTKVAITRVILRCCFFIWLSPLVLNKALY